MSPRDADTQSIGEFLARHQVAEHERSGSLRKRWRGGFELPLGSRYFLALFVFQAGAVLGRAHARSADIHAKRFRSRSPSGAIEWFDVDAESTRQLGEQQLLMGSDATSFWGWLKTRRFPDVGVATAGAEGSKWLGMSEVLAMANKAFVDGVALGVVAPDLVEALWERTSTIDRAHWDEAVAAGLKIPTEPVLLELAQLEDWVLSESRAYLEGRTPEENSVAEELTSLGSFWFFSQLVHPGLENQRPDSDAASSPPVIGREIQWLQIVRQVFRVLDFDRADTKIVNDKVVDPGPDKPYGYLFVSSPLLNGPAILPIIHRDDFWLAASVFDDPQFADVIQQGELLVTYAPRTVLPNGFNGEPTHCLHYVLTPSGTLGHYYDIEGGLHARQPAPEALFGSFAYEGRIAVGVNRSPTV